MPKLSAVKDKDMVRILEKLGFEKHRHSGTSHLVMKHSDGRRTTVSIHAGKDIPTGTLLAILRDANIPRDGFIKLL
ncbi:MAG: type II toxin-antitoxin system HicA family toxin [Candidatus Yonathbacteria bacterium]|nr:type II toxin-antitoxin system HicA family toxin [Candidatus Yonathbacteria bacterium]